MDPVSRTLRFLALAVATFGFVFTLACGVLGSITGFTAITYAMLFVFCGAIAVILTGE
jgi:hypothetical protein